MFAGRKARDDAVRVGKHQGIAVARRVRAGSVQGKVGPAEAIADALDVALDAGTLDMAQRRGGLQRCRCAGAAQGEAEWMAVGLFERGGNAEGLLEAAADDLDAGALEIRLGQGAGLVEDETIGPGQRLECIGIDDENTALGQHGDGAGQRRGHRQGKCARTTDHQHGQSSGQGATWIKPGPGQGGDQGRGEHTHDKARRTRIRQPRQCRPFAGGAGDHAHDAGKHGIGTDVTHDHLDRPVNDQAAGNQRLAGFARDRRGFAAEQGFINAASWPQQFAIGGNRRATADADDVAGLQFMHGNRRVARRLAALGQYRLQARQGIDDIAGAMPRAHGQMPPEQQEQDKHADRIEIDLVAANEDVDHAGQVDQGDGQRHRRIHRQAARAPLAHGTAEERLCRVQHDRSGNEEADPAEELAHRRVDAVEYAGIQGHGHHHRLHGAEPGDNQALERGT